MNNSFWQKSALVLAATGLVVSVPAEAKHRTAHNSRHGDCLRFNKTTGAVAGAAGGAVLGKVILGGTGGLLVGAAAGGIAGHKLAHNRRKRCR